MMRRWVWLFLLAAACPLTVIGQQENVFTINGRINGADGKMISLFNDLSSTPQDSAKVNNSAFRFRGTIDSAGLYALFLQDHNTPLVIILTPGTLSVTSSIDSFPLATVKGNKQSEAMADYQHSFRRLTEKAKALNRQAAGISGSDTAAIAHFRAAADAFNEEVKATGLQFIHEHESSLASVLVLVNELRSRLSPVEMKTTFAALSDQVKNSRYGRDVATYIENMAATAEGAIAPDFTQNDVTGKPVSLSSFRGKYVLVDFWASWCGPCRNENPHVVQAYHQYKDKNFTILGVSLDHDRSNWLNAIKQDNLSWTQVSDLQGWQNAAAAQYHIQSIPANLLIGPDGKIIARNLRGDDLQATLQEVLP